MISPELLRRYPFFSLLSEAQLIEIAMISDEVDFNSGETLFEEGQPANALYLLINGSIDLFFKSEEEYHPTTCKEFTVGEINPGDIFGIGALIDPYIFDATARTSQNCQTILINASALRELVNKDHDLAYNIASQLLKVVMARLHSTRVQLAAARD